MELETTSPMPEEHFNWADDLEDISELDYKENELRSIAELAQHIGLFTWKYDEGIGDSNIHDGPVAQDLLNCEGLKNAVTNNNGILEIDTKYVALAALSYIATLTRILTGIEYEGIFDNYKTDGGITETTEINQPAENQTTIG